MYCSKCGNKLEEGTQFCNKCGNLVTNNNVNEKNKNDNKKKWSIWVIIAGIIIGIICVKGLATIIENSQQRTYERNLRNMGCVEFIEKI